MIVTNLLGCKVRPRGAGERGPSTHFKQEIVGVYLDVGVPMVLLLESDGTITRAQTSEIQVKEEKL